MPGEGLRARILKGPGAAHLETADVDTDDVIDIVPQMTLCASRPESRSGHPPWTSSSKDSAASFPRPAQVRAEAIDRSPAGETLPSSKTTLEQSHRTHTVAYRWRLSGGAASSTRTEDPRSGRNGRTLTMSRSLRPGTGESICHSSIRRGLPANGTDRSLQGCAQLRPRVEGATSEEACRRPVMNYHQATLPRVLRVAERGLNDTVDNRSE